MSTDNSIPAPEREPFQSPLAKLQDECEQARQRVLSGMRVGLQPVSPKSNEDFLAVFFGGRSGVYWLPELEPLWDEAAALDLGTVPDFPGEPSNGREALRALDILLAWCRSRETIGAVLQPLENHPPVPPPSQLSSPPSSLPRHVTLDQMAAVVSRSKRTLEKLLSRTKDPMPGPDVEGGGGRPHEWLWAHIRPWLEKEYGRQLPEQYPQWRPPSGS